jgi:tRNA dimethylallyltransferase
MKSELHQILNTNHQIPLVVIVGPTASGKTGLAIEVAKKIGGEIICADSRTIYSYMDIGTAKPTVDERSQVPHWGLDIVEPGEYFSASDFKDYTIEKIADIKSRGNIPILVGGTGLYIDSVIFDYQFGPKVDLTLRQKLQHMTLDELYSYCVEKAIELPENIKNKRYVIRAIERNNHKPQRSICPLKNTIIVGIATDKADLLNHIESRIGKMLDDGLINETRQLSERFGWDYEAMKSNAYSVIRGYLNNDISINDVKKTLITLDWKLAKRQMTWLRRNTFINWLDIQKAEDYIYDRVVNFE